MGCKGKEVSVEISHSLSFAYVQFLVVVKILFVNSNSDMLRSHISLS